MPALLPQPPVTDGEAGAALEEMREVRGGLESALGGDLSHRRARRRSQSECEAENPMMPFSTLRHEAYTRLISTSTLNCCGCLRSAAAPRLFFCGILVMPYAQGMVLQKLSRRQIQNTMFISDCTPLLQVMA